MADGIATKRLKTIIVCCDGTWKNSDNGWEKDGFLGLGPGRLAIPSNVTRFARAVAPENSEGHPQIVYYQAGVGSGWSVTDKLLGGGTGEGLSENIREAYAFLVNNYAPGDKIVLVGFSRGAFTARSIGGLITSFGLLTKKGRGMQFFYDIFRDWENAGDKNYAPRIKERIPDFDLGVDDAGKPITAVNLTTYLAAYKRALGDLTQDVYIEAIGVWDTVGALGIPVNPAVWKLLPWMPPFLQTHYNFNDTGLDNHVKNAFQALALDEHRSAFSPTVWEHAPDSTTNLEQVWFSGVHSSVGGGYSDTGIADLTLTWMLEKMRTIVTFDEDYLKQQISLNQDFYANPPKKGLESPLSLHGKVWRWALGLVYDSNQFPTSLSGTLHRTPLLYHRTEYDTGRAKPELLSNTTEKIHPSVRIRYESADGLDFAGKKYASKALKDWKLDGNKWVYSGKHKDGMENGNPKVIYESVLTGYELELLARDKETEAKVLAYAKSA